MAEERKLRIGVELTGEETFKQSLSKIETGLKNVKAAQTGLNSEYDKGDKSLSKLAQQQQLLQAKLTLQRQKLEEIRKEHERVAQAEGENSDKAQDLARQYEYARAQCNNTERELQGLSKELSEAESKTKKFKETLASAGGKLEEIGEKITKVGTTLTKTLTTTLGGALGYCTKQFLDFEEGMNTVATIADTTEVSLAELSQGAIKASNETGVAAKQITEAAYSAISAGVDTKNAMDFTAKAAKAAKAGLTDVSTTVNGSTSIMNAWKIASEDATMVFDKMIVAQNKGKTTIGEIAGSIGQITGLAPQLNISLDETLSAIAALTKNGVQTSTAINGLKNVFSAVLKPTSEATQRAKELGLEFNAAAIQSKGLTGFLADVIDKTGGSEEELAKLFGSVQGLSSVMLLAKGAAGDYADTLAAMGESAGELDKAFSTVTSGRAAQLSKAMNELNNNAIMLGQAAAPMVDLASNAIGRLADILNSMTPAEQQTLVTIAGVLAGVGPLVVGIGKVVTAGGKLLKGLSSMNIATMGWVGVALAAIAAVVAGIVLLKKHLDSISGEGKLKAVFSDVKVDTTKIDEAIKKAEEAEHQMKIEAEAKINFKQTAEDINKQVQSILDGTPDVKKIQEKVDAWLDPVYKTITDSYNAKKAALDAALAAGLFSQDQYDAELEKLTKGTNDAKAALDAEKKAYLDYINEIIEGGQKPTAEQLAKLEEMRKAIEGVGKEVQGAGKTFEGSSLNSYIEKWLTDGKIETKDQKEHVKQLVDDWLQPVFDQIDASYKEKKEALDALLAGGIIDQSTYEANLAELNSTTEATKTALTKEKDAYVKYVMELAAANKKPTEEQLATLKTLEEQLTTTANNILNMEFLQGGVNVGDYVTKALTEGQKPTEEQIAAWKKSVDDWLSPVFDSITTAYNEKKATLDAALANGVIDKEKYEADLAALTTSTNESKEALEKEKAAYIAYVEEIAKQSGGATQEQIDKLNEMRDTILGIGQSILEANSLATQAAKGAYTLVTAGSPAATVEDIAVAVKYAQVDQATRKQAAKDLYDQELAALQKAWGEAQDAEGKAQVELQMSEAAINYQNTVASIESDYTAMINEIMAGIAAKYPQMAEAANKIAELQAQIEAKERRIKAYGSDITKLDLPELSDKMQLEREVSDLKGQMAGLLKDKELTGLFTDLSAAWSAGLSTGFDYSQAEAITKNLLTVFDLSDDAKTAGEQMILGEISGINGQQGGLNQAVIDSCEKANQALRNKQGINSPSRVWEGYGRNTMQGYANGIRNGQGAVTSAINTFARALYNYGQNTINSLIRGANSRRSALVSAYKSLAKAAAQAAKEGLDIHSPSKPFREFGENTGDALILGINRKVDAVKMAMKNMVNPKGVLSDGESAFAEPGAALAGAGGRGGNTIIVNYSGAVTNRDSRKLAQQLGRYTDKQNRAKGR